MSRISTTPSLDEIKEQYLQKAKLPVIPEEDANKLDREVTIEEKQQAIKRTGMC